MLVFQWGYVQESIITSQHYCHRHRGNVAGSCRTQASEYARFLKMCSQLRQPYLGSNSFIEIYIDIGGPLNMLTTFELARYLVKASKINLSLCT